VPIGPVSQGFLLIRGLEMSRSLIFDTYRDQWAWKKIGLEKAWARVAAAMQQQSADNEQITVAIVDCGIKADHEAFVENRQLVSCDRVITPRDGTCGDDDGHGTMLAGTIAGVINPRCGDRVRVPPVRLLSVKFIDWYTPPMSRNAAEAIRHAVDQGARIINASWEVGLKSRELEEAMQDASNKGVLVIVAAGNNGGNEDDYRTYPAGLDLPNLISVMASDREMKSLTFPIMAAILSILRPRGWISSALFPTFTGRLSRLGHMTRPIAAIAAPRRRRRTSQARQHSCWH
jgi:subtilisin family serine protease